MFKLYNNNNKKSIREARLRRKKRRKTGNLFFYCIAKSDKIYYNYANEIFIVV